MQTNGVFLSTHISCSFIYLFIYLFITCNWVDTRWRESLHVTFHMIKIDTFIWNFCVLVQNMVRRP